MTQNIQPTNITKEQNNFVEIDRGGTLRYGIGRIYWNYNFEPLSGLLYNPDVAKIYSTIGTDFAKIISENHIVNLSFEIKKLTPEKRNFLGKWTPPTYSETPAQQEIKKNLAYGKYGKCLWGDYEWYAEFPFRSPITNLLTSTRWYTREVNITMNNLNTLLIEHINNCREDDGAIGIRIFPHSNIESLNSDKETIRSYIHRDDFIVHIAFDDKWTGIHIEPNPQYMNYEQLIEIIEPIFEKHGLKIINRDAPNPNLKSGFSPDEEFTYHNKYPCAGYQFFD